MVTAKYCKTFLATWARFILRLQNYTKKMALANKSAIFLYFYSFSAYYAMLLRDASRCFMSIYFSPLFYAVGKVRPEIRLTSVRDDGYKSPDQP